MINHILQMLLLIYYVEKGDTKKITKECASAAHKINSGILIFTVMLCNYSESELF